MTTRESILDAADQLFGELGFDAATTREISERSQVNKALIHYHFGSKEGLLTAVLERYFGRLEVALVEAVSKPGRPRQRVYRLLEAHVDFLATNRSFSAIVQREAAGGNQMDWIRDRMLPMLQHGRSLLAPMLTDPDLQAEDLMITFYGMVASYFTYADLLGPMLGRDPLSPDSLEQRKRHLRRMADLVLSELGIPPDDPAEEHA